MTQRSYSGFTLVEMTIVLVVVALLISGLIIPLSTQNDMRNRQDTERQLAEIKEALIGFASVNGRLPCPAAAGVPTGVANAGTEAVSAAGGPCSCSAPNSGLAAYSAIDCDDIGPDSVGGVVPWATLALKETDAWGTRFTYRVTTRFARVASGQTMFGCAPAEDPVASAFALCSAGDMRVDSTTGGTTIANNLPAVVISHGSNTLGGFLPTGAPAGLATSADETENVLTGTSVAGNAHNVFVSKTSVMDPANAFDDHIVWVPPNILMSKMITVGRLP